MTASATTWTMLPSDVDAVTKLKEWTTFAFEVGGSQNAVAWLCKQPAPTIEIDLAAGYGVYVSSEEGYPGDTVLSTISRFSVELGTAYKWDGHDLTPDHFATCDKGTVKMTNKDEDSTKMWTFGMTQQDPDTQVAQPICCDSALYGEPTVYTPPMGIAAKVGGDDKAGAVIKDFSADDWAKLVITGSKTSFTYDATQKKWAVSSV